MVIVNSELSLGKFVVKRKSEKTNIEFELLLSQAFPLLFGLTISHIHLTWYSENHNGAISCQRSYIMQEA